MQIKKVHKNIQKHKKQRRNVFTDESDAPSEDEEAVEAAGGHVLVGLVPRNNKRKYYFINYHAKKIKKENKISLCEAP